MGNLWKKANRIGGGAAGHCKDGRDGRPATIIPITCTWTTARVCASSLPLPATEAFHRNPSRGSRACDRHGSSGPGGWLPTVLQENQRMADHVLTDIFFEQFDLHPQLAAGLADCGFVRCTPIQALTLPVALAGRDVAGQAQTGTGKTCAFLVAVMNRLLTKPAMPERHDNDP